jgi:hypothetical protein
LSHFELSNFNLSGFLLQKKVDFSQKGQILPETIIFVTGLNVGSGKIAGMALSAEGDVVLSLIYRMSAKISLLRNVG